MADPFVVNIPAAPFHSALVALTHEIVESVKTNSAFAMSTVFDFIELTANNSALQQKLTGRGSFAPDSTGIYKNRGSAIDELVHDLSPAIGDLQLYLPRQVKVRPVLQGGGVDLALVDTRVMATFFTPPAPGLSNRYLLSNLTLGPQSATYNLVSEDASGQNVQLNVDYLSQPTLITRGAASSGFVSADLQLMAASMFLENNCCGGFQVKECNIPAGPRCVTLHAKILYTPSLSIDDQLAGMNAVFAAADLTVHLGSVEFLTLPDLLDVEVGTCMMGETTDDQRRLFSHRNHSGPNDICAYWVRSLIPGFAGCAAHPDGQPSVVCYPRGSAYLLAHEVAHVLGLRHAGGSDYLMYDYDAHTNPPPDIVASEVNTLRCSRLSSAC